LRCLTSPFLFQARTEQYNNDKYMTGELPMGPGAALAAIIGKTPPEDWTREQIQDIKEIAHQMRGVRNDPSLMLLGPEQLDFLEGEASQDQVRRGYEEGGKGDEAGQRGLPR